MREDDPAVEAARSHRELLVWRKAMDLVVEVYRVSELFPSSERYRLTAQVTRAVVSIPANIAEGNARHSRREYAHFLDIARGSALEAETLLMVSERLGYVGRADLASAFDRITEVSKMLYALRRRIVAG